MCRCEEQDSVLAGLWETAEGRRRVHRANQVWGSCDARLVFGGRELLRHGTVVPRRRELERACLECGRPCHEQPAPFVPTGGAFRLLGDCPCADFLADALASMFGYLADESRVLRNVPAAARLHVRKRQHDHIRASRLARGAQVRTDRLMHSAIGRRLASEEQRHLLRDLADEAGSDAPLESDAHLLQRLAALRARRCGGEPADLVAEVRRDREVVRAACLDNRQVNVGTTFAAEYVSWWDAYIERPLGRRRRASDLSLDREDDPWIGTGPIGEVGRQRTDVDDSGEALLDTIHRLDDDGTDPASLLGGAIASLSRTHEIDARTVNEFLASDVRRAAALQAIAELQASWRADRQAQNVDSPPDDDAAVHMLAG